MLRWFAKARARPWAALAWAAWALATLGILTQASKQSSDSTDGPLTIFRVQAQSQDPQKLSPYHIIATHIGERLGEEVQVKFAETTGSFTTLLQIERTEDRPALGIVQADVLYHYVNGRHPHFPIPTLQSRVRAIARLFPEWLHAYRHPSPRWEKMTLLEAPAVYAGPNGTGSMVTATNLSRVLRVDWEANIRSTRMQGTKPNPDRELESPQADEAYRVWFEYLGPHQVELKVRAPLQGGQHPDDVRDWTPIFMPHDSALIMENAFGPEVYKVVEPLELCEMDYHCSSDTKDAEQQATIKVDAILVGNTLLSEAAIESIIAAISSDDDAGGTRSDGKTVRRGPHFQPALLRRAAP